jgi:hypothetical protein
MIEYRPIEEERGNEREKCERLLLLLKELSINYICTYIGKWDMLSEMLYHHCTYSVPM